VAAPLTHQGDTFGAISFAFHGASAFGVVDEAFTLLLAQATGTALHRSMRCGFVSAVCRAARMRPLPRFVSASMCSSLIAEKSIGYSPYVAQHSRSHRLHHVNGGGTNRRPGSRDHERPA
jgi:hypothetical protein